MSRRCSAWPAGRDVNCAGGSIIGRMRRHGGRAEIRSEPGAGTEVRLFMPTPAEPRRTARVGDWLGGVWAAEPGADDKVGAADGAVPEHAASKAAGRGPGE